jgi:hypothetical protein
MDPLEDLPPASRIEVIAAIQTAWRTDAAGAEAILRASEPFWNVLEDHGVSTAGAAWSSFASSRRPSQPSTTRAIPALAPRDGSAPLPTNRGDPLAALLRGQVRRSTH